MRWTLIGCGWEVVGRGGFEPWWRCLPLQGPFGEEEGYSQQIITIYGHLSSNYPHIRVSFHTFGEEGRPGIRVQGELDGGLKVAPGVGGDVNTARYSAVGLRLTVLIQAALCIHLSL